MAHARTAQRIEHRRSQPVVVERVEEEPHRGAPAARVAQRPGPVEVVHADPVRAEPVGTQPTRERVGEAGLARPVDTVHADHADALGDGGGDPLGQSPQQAVQVHAGSLTDPDPRRPPNRPNRDGHRPPAHREGPPAGGLVAGPTGPV